MRGWRGLLAGVIGLSLFELVASTDRGSTLVAGALQYPAQWLHDLADPTKPGIPQVSKSTASQSIATGPGVVVPAVAGLSGTPTTTGTGSQTLPAGGTTLPPTYT